MQPIQPGDRIVYDIWFWVKSILISGGGAGAIIGWWLYNRGKKRIPVHAHEVKKELEDLRVKYDKLYIMAEGDKVSQLALEKKYLDEKVKKAIFD